MNGGARIWLTRPRADSLRMAEALLAHGIPSLVAPLSEIEPLPIDWPQQKPDALLLTSRHGAASLASLPNGWHDLPCYCVGEATAELARQQGLPTIITGEGGMQGLLPKLRDLPPGSTLFYPSGEEIRVDIATLLAARGVTVQRAIAYRARAAQTLDAAVQTALRQGELQGMVLCSVRAVQLAKTRLQQASLPLGDLTLYCLSLEIAAEAASLGGGRLLSCHQPTHDAMMELLFTHAIATA